MHWPIHFAIISAYSDAAPDKPVEHVQADEDFHEYLINHYSWVKRITAVDNEHKTLKPSWAVNIDWNVACEISYQLGQETVYYVADNTLTVSYSDQRRKPFHVGAFLQRLTNPRI